MDTRQTTITSFIFKISKIIYFWVKYNFRPCKKFLKNIPAKKKYLKKVLDPTFLLIWHGFGYVAVADRATLATWR